MSSVQHLREFISARLTAAAEEIFTEFIKTIEEELQRQSRQLDISWRTQRDTAELPQLVCKKKIQIDQHFYNQEEPEPAQNEEDQEEPEPAQSEDREELYTDQDVEQLVLKEESDMFVETSTFEENESDLNSKWLHFQNSAVPESPDLQERKQEGLRSDRSRELKPKTRAPTNRSAASSDQTSAMTVSRCDSGNTWPESSCDAGQKSYSCSFCGKEFKQKKKLTQHIRTHTDERPYSCKWCEKSFHQSAHLIAHKRIHTGERPYACSFCDKSFRDLHTQKRHIRSHTGERPYACETCGESFPRREYLLVHMRTHTG